MRISSASTLAALAFGLMLSGSVAYAADAPAGGPQGKQDSEHPNDRGHGDQHAKPPAKVHTGKPAKRDTSHQNNGGTHNNIRAVDQNHPSNWNNGNSRTVDQSNRNNRRTADLSRWHRNFNAPRQFHAGSYRAPRGYNYQRWAYGQRLPRDYYARDFWLADFVMFGLMSPPDGYVWVRYGPDALLIDEETGEIIQVEYNVFYS